MGDPKRPLTRVAVVGATGYAGGEVVRLLLGHPGVRIVAAVARSHQGEPLRDVQRHLHGAPASLRVGSDVADAEVVITALPSGESAKQARRWLDEGRSIIDVGSDFRLADPAEHERWYGAAHPAPELLGQAVYGLAEIHREAIRGARLVSNPGCYPTAALLALAPAVRAGIIEEDVIVDAKSGVSGAGHTVDEQYLYGSVDASVRPYGVPKHRHTPEIAGQLERIGGGRTRLTFTPHIVPMTRGLLATCYARLRGGVDAAEVARVYGAAYAGEPFVRVTAAFPRTKDVSGSNWCLVHAVVDEDNGRLVAVGAIDNLVKGAAGSAVQNLNLMTGHPETSGLQGLPAWP